MKKIGQWALLALCCLLSACSSGKDCGDSDVFDSIREVIAKSVYVVPSAKDAIREAKISDVFTFRKSDDGTYTCKAKISVQTPKGSSGGEFSYVVINYESGFEVEVNNDAMSAIRQALAVYIDIERVKEEERRTERERQKKADLDAFFAKFPSGNVCADHFDRSAFVGKNVDKDLTVDNIGYFYGQYSHEIAQKVVDDFARGKVEVVNSHQSDNPTYPRPTDPSDLTASEMRYECEGDLQVVLADGSIYKADDLSYFLTTDGRDFRYDAEDYNLTKAANKYASHLATGN